MMIRIGPLVRVENMKNFRLVLSLLTVVIATSCQREEALPSPAVDRVSEAPASVARPIIAKKHSDDRGAVNRTVPLVGAWREVAALSDGDGEPGYKLGVFPRVPARETRFSVYDYDAGHVICCMRVDGDGLDLNYLLDNLNIAAPRAIELLDVLWEGQPGYSPMAVKLAIEGDFSKYESKDWERKFDGDTWLFNVERGAILLPEGSRIVAPHLLQIEGKNYDVSWSTEWIGADDGVREIYVFKPQSGGDELRVGVSYSSAR